MILILNAGSSSLKFSVYDEAQDALLFRGMIDRLGAEAELLDEESFTVKEGVAEVKERTPCPVKDHGEAIRFAIDHLLHKRIVKRLKDITAVGHRVVHGGERFSEATIIDDEVIVAIENLAELAPLHNPINLTGILESRLLKVPHIAVFDTAYYEGLPEHVISYALPRMLREAGARKYGFHGTNHKYCARRVAELHGEMPKRLVTCHLGNGSSITAHRHGVPIETSMGFTPLDGLPMGSRCGAIDPGLLLHLLNQGTQVDVLNRLLWRESGLLGLVGTSDMRDVHEKAVRGDEAAALAMKLLVHRIVGYIGAYATHLGGLDCLCFTGGMGEGAWYVRSAVCAQLGAWGVKLDAAANKRNAERIGAGDTAVFVVPANEELQIGRETAAVLKS